MPEQVDRVENAAPLLGNRALIYERISIDKENVENQEKRLVAVCDEKGWEIAFEPVRETEHGKKGQVWESGNLVEKREGLIAILKSAKAREFDILIVYHHDRLTRGGGTALVNYIMQFASLGVRIYDFDDRKFLEPPKTGIDEAVQNITGTGARLYQEEVVRKTKNKLGLIKQALDRDGAYITDAGRRITALGRPQWKVGKRGQPSFFLTERDLKDISIMYKDGFSLRSIARKHGCSIGTVKKVVTQ